MAFFTLERFKIADFGSIIFNLKGATQSRKKHAPIHKHWEPIQTHDAIPSTFDGTISQF